MGAARPRARPAASAALTAVFAAAGASLGGCGLILGLDDHELFPDTDATTSAPSGVEAGGSELDAAPALTEGSTGSQAPDGSDASVEPDGAQPADGAGPIGPSDVVALPCPWTPCAAGTTCCSGAGGDNCESSCELGSYPLTCTGADQCDAGACCATLEAVAGARGAFTGPAPRCNGWGFRGSTCGACDASPPTQCGATFTLQMCASTADCPTAQPYCCHVTEDNPFTYCVDSTLSTTPSTCLPP